MKKFALIFPFLLLFLPAQGATGAARVDTDAVVIKITSELLGIPPRELKLALPFSKQSTPADELDIVEVVMAVEDALHINIDDKALNAQAGASDFKDKLTIQHLQQVAATLYREKNATPTKKNRR